MATAPDVTGLSAIESDLPCAICGYNLKGLSPAGSCPECGQEIARTFAPELVRSDPQWLRQQATTMLFLAGLCLANFRPFNSGFRGEYYVSLVLTLITAGAGAWGCWRLARPEPPGAPGDWEATLQRAVRIAPLVYLGVLVLWMVPGAFARGFWTAAGLTAMAGLIIADALVGWFMYRLARRTNDRFLMLHARVVMWAFPLAQLVSILWSLIAPLIDDRTARLWAYSMYGIFTWLGGIAVYLTLLLLGRMYEVLRAAARTADAGRTAIDSKKSLADAQPT